MNILGIESSCDETAAAVVRDGREILSNVVVSQIDLFKAYGGVIPEVAARSHLEAILPVVDRALKDADLSWSDLDALAVTHTPGLLGSLLVGTLTARTFALLHDLPLFPVHHLKSHAYAAWLKPEKTPKNLNTPENPEPPLPALVLVASGGHTQILHMPAHDRFEIIGTTRDDAVGECFDKVAKILGLPYPGGPAISAAAKTGDPEKYKLPRPKVPDLDFSFSGLKTAVLRAVQSDLGLPYNHPSHDLKSRLSETQIADFAASFESTAVEILLDKLTLALREFPARSVILAGGVSANALLRARAESRFPAVFFPEKSFSTDNAAMVAAAAFYEIRAGKSPSDPYKISLSPRSAINAT